MSFRTFLELIRGCFRVIRLQNFLCRPAMVGNFLFRYFVPLYFWAWESYIRQNFLRRPTKVSNFFRYFLDLPRWKLALNQRKLTLQSFISAKKNYIVLTLKKILYPPLRVASNQAASNEETRFYYSKIYIRYYYFNHSYKNKILKLRILNLTFFKES